MYFPLYDQYYYALAHKNSWPTVMKFTLHLYINNIYKYIDKEIDSQFFLIKLDILLLRMNTVTSVIGLLSHSL